MAEDKKKVVAFRKFLVLVPMPKEKLQIPKMMQQLMMMKTITMMKNLPL
jgi:hypothetical protein